LNVYIAVDDGHVDLSLTCFK